MGPSLSPHHFSFVRFSVPLPVTRSVVSCVTWSDSLRLGSWTSVVNTSTVLSSLDLRESLVDRVEKVSRLLFGLRVSPLSWMISCVVVSHRSDSDLGHRGLGVGSRERCVIRNQVGRTRLPDTRDYSSESKFNLRFLSPFEGN